VLSNVIKNGVHNGAEIASLHRVLNETHKRMRRTVLSRLLVDVVINVDATTINELNGSFIKTGTSQLSSDVNVAVKVLGVKVRCMFTRLLLDRRDTLAM